MTTLRFGRRRHGPLRAQGGTADRDLVTILICNHNYERYLATAIDSVLAQTYRTTEIIVIDDGSTDGSRALLETYRDRVHVIFKSNGGQPSALNAGFRESRGAFICLLDADDRFAPTKVERVFDVFERNPDAGWVFHELDYIDEAGRPLELEALADRAHARTVLRRRARYGEFAHIDLRANFAAGDKLGYACPAFSALSFRRSTLDAILPMPEDIARASDEFPKWAAIALFPGIHLGVALAQQRLHAANAASLRTDGRVEAATRYLKTAYHLRHRYAHIGPSTDKWFASSFGQLVGVMGTRAALSNEESRRYLKHYFRPMTWVRQAPRIAFHAARERLASRDGGAGAQG